VNGAACAAGMPKPKARSPTAANSTTFFISPPLEIDDDA
jgi:hypothetical protein